MSIFGPVGDGGDPRLNVMPDYFHETNGSLAVGFSDAARTLVERWVNERTPNDTHFVPILLLYRHALELILKQSILDAAACLRRRDRDMLAQDELETWLRRKAGHSLQRLADKLEEYLDRLGIETIPAATLTVLTEMHALDPAGETFRYAEVWDNTSKQTVAAQRPTETHINIEEMGKAFDRAFGLLADGLVTLLDQYREHLDEMVRDADGW